jgi:hypothetical protein
VWSAQVSSVSSVRTWVGPPTTLAGKTRLIVRETYYQGAVMPPINSKFIIAGLVAVIVNDQFVKSYLSRKADSLQKEVDHAHEVAMYMAHVLADNEVPLTEFDLMVLSDHMK